MLFNPAIERPPLPRLRALQNAQLREQVAYVYDRVPFYRQKLAALGVRPATFRGLKDLGKLGFTKKTDFGNNYPFGLFTGPENEVARLHCSSGTTGKATVEVNFFPTQVGDILSGLPQASPYYQVVASRRGSLNEVQVRVEIVAGLMRDLGLETVTADTGQQHDCLQALQGSFAKKIKSHSRLSMKVTLLGFGTRPRSEGGTLSRVRDLRALT